MAKHPCFGQPPMSLRFNYRPGRRRRHRRLEAAGSGSALRYDDPQATFAAGPTPLHPR